MHEPGCKSNGARNKSQHATGSENYTINIMIKIIILGSELLAAAQTRLETCGPIHAELQHNFHLKIEDFRCGLFIWATYTAGAMQMQKVLAQDSQNALEFLQLLSGSIIVGANAVLQRHHRTSSLPL